MCKIQKNLSHFNRLVSAAGDYVVQPRLEEKRVEVPPPQLQPASNIGRVRFELGMSRTYQLPIDRQTVRHAILRAMINGFSEPVTTRVV